MFYETIKHYFFILGGRDLKVLINSLELLKKRLKSIQSLQSRNNIENFANVKH